VLEQIEGFKRLDDDLERPFRMPLQDVYKFTAAGDDRRIFVGTVETGRIRPGDEVVFLPSGKRSTVATIEALSGPRPDEAYAGQATGLTLDTQVYAKPGELMVRADEPAPLVADRLRANIFWMATAPLVRGRRYVLRMGAARVPVELESVLSVLDSQELQSVTGAAQVERHDVAEVVFRSTRPVAFDAAETLEPTSRFVVVAGFDTAGCGIALEALPEAAASADGERRFGVGEVTEAQRAADYGHGGKAVVFVGESGEDAHAVAASLERRIFELGVHSYCLSATDLGEDKDVLGREAQIGRLGEIAWALTDAGIVLVAALGDMDRFDLDRLRTLAAPHEVFVIGRGDGGDLGADLDLPATLAIEEAAQEALRALTAAGVLPEHEA
jgi:bifunctional enzyme CysN/CysC